ncbi:MAG: TIGR00296 family protein [Methanoregulaceae archaeon]|jgi:uncharacterized protein (TIGR00296 family)
MNLLTDDEGEMAVSLARGTIEHKISNKQKPVLDLTSIFQEKRGVFVTLNKEGNLRGCIGFPYPMIPLANAIEQAAIASALEDPRFPQVRPNELKLIDLEVTILTVPEPLNCSPEERPSKIEVGKHGLIIRGLGTSGLLLPQVATDYGWDSKTFLDHTCMKAGLPNRCWMHDNVEVLAFEGQIFSELHNKVR